MMQKTRLLSLIAMLVFGGLSEVIAQYNSINIDYQTAAVMVAEYNAAAAAEMYYDEQVKDILDKYGIAEVAAAGIYTSKHLDRKALTSLGNWSSSSENYYYRRIYNLVSAKIIPELWDLSSLLLRYPHKAIYWGTYLIKTTTEVKSLCQQFESVVTNGTLSFSDINFLEVNPTIASIIQLSKIGDVDWKSLLNSITYVGQSFSKENLQDDVDRLYSLGAELATSGFSNLSEKILGNSSFGGTFVERAASIYNVAANIYDIYTEADGDIVNVLKSCWGENPTAADLFSFSSYNIGSWMSDYLSEASGSYYTQRYYIACRDEGRETVCSYTPSTDDSSILYGGEWVRFNTSDPSFWPSASQFEQVLSNSEGYAGWSRSLVSTLNAQNSGYSYSFYSSPSSYVITSGGRQVRKAYAYSIQVVKSWRIDEVVMEEVFDSYTMSLPIFLEKMNGYLAEYNENEQGKVYQLLHDDKVYYEVADEAKVKGCESAIISMTCSDEINLGEGDTQYKCNTCGRSLDSHSKECAMRTTLPSDDDLNDERTQLEDEITRLEREISSTRMELEDCLEQKAYLESLLEGLVAGTEEYLRIRQQLSVVNATIAADENTLSSLNSELDQYEKALDELESDDELPTDDYHRIPAIMQEVQQAYRLSWQGEGWWSGYTYSRYATSPLVRGTITFSATLSLARKPQYFLGIKIHRAIMKISWALSSSFSDTEVVDNITLDPDASDEEKADIINRRLSELARDFPGCTTSVEYIKADDDEVEDETEDVQHLLWSSDRLAIARQVEARLVSIYSDIVSMRKMMHYKLSVIDAIGGAVPYVNDEEGRNHSLAEKCRRRWLRNAADRHHSLGYNGKYEDYEEDTE